MTIRGAVQGVGFRPFVYRLAAELELNGWVNNTARGVFVEVEGARAKLDWFLLRVEREKPAISFIQSLESSFADPVGYAGFEIRKSEGGEKTALVMPDIATCPECLAKSSTRCNRRFGYPFTNCTNCGPRYTHHRVAALRPAAHHDEEIHHVRRVRARVRRPGEPQISRPAQRLSGVRSATRTLEHGGRGAGAARKRRWTEAAEAMRRGRDRWREGIGRLPPDGGCAQ